MYSIPPYYYSNRMKNVSDSLQAQWQENKQQLNNLLEQQERIFTDLLRYPQQTETTHGHDFFVKDDYVRIVVEIKARELLGELWPGKWHSMPMLADMLTPIVGWIVSPNSLWRTMNKIEKFKDEINRRVTQLRK